MELANELRTAWAESDFGDGLKQPVADASEGSDPDRRYRPTAAARAAISIFPIAATDPTSYRLEECLQSLGQTVRSDLSAALLHGVPLTDRGR